MQGLYLILTNPVTGYERCAEAAVACGVRWLQLRMKRAPRDEIIASGFCCTPSRAVRRRAW